MSQGLTDQQAQQQLGTLVSCLYNPAWELCRRGIIRPGVKSYRAQATEDGMAGNGYCITPFGKKWLDDASDDFYIPTEPERLGEMLEKYKEKFREGFHQRAQEAVRCYGAHAYLSCCSMCGAAAESIMLIVAQNKKSDEDIFRLYSASNGRRKIENMVIGDCDERIKRGFLNGTDLLKYWRDASSHGEAVFISENEAFTSIVLLLRFCNFVDENFPSSM